MTESGYDAAYPPAHPPDDAVCMLYLGGDTPHVATLAEWDSQPARFRLGIWTRSDPAGHDGATEAREAVAQWRSLGAPAGTLIGLDLETAVDAAYVTAFDAGAVAEGFEVVAYGSKSTLFRNPRPSGGYFVADLTDTPHLYPDTVMTQYAFGQSYDSDTVEKSLHLWDTRPPAPPTHSTPGVDMPYLVQTHPDPTNPDNAGYGVFLVDGGTVVHIKDSADVAVFAGRFGEALTISPGQYADMISRQPSEVANASASLASTSIVRAL